MQDAVELQVTSRISTAGRKAPCHNPSCGTRIRLFILFTPFQLRATGLALVQLFAGSLERRATTRLMAFVGDRTAVYRMLCGADPILTHRADRKMTQGGALRF